MNYYDFLAKKQVQNIRSGFEADIHNKYAFDWQKVVAKWALRQGKAALFEDCGLGKTLQELMWAEQVHRHTNAPVMIVAPLAVSVQTKREAEKFGIECSIAETSADVTNGINITNYEKIGKFDCGVFSGVVLDESSILKSYMGKIKRSLVEKFSETPYRLAATATPAPNDLMELLNHAEFLGIMRSCEALAIWFLADQSESGKYRLKRHAAADFWRWVTSWAVCIETPEDIGFDGSGYVLPPLNEVDEIVQSDILSDNLEDGFFREINMSATGYHTEKRKSLESRCKRTAELAENIDGQVVVWCGMNDEADLLKKLIPNSVEIRGSDTAAKKERAALDFICGDIRVLISKPSIFGYGLNFQNCRNTIFCGMDYSFENYYQAVRRFHRFGQTGAVNVYRVIGSTELDILNTVNRKAAQKAEMAESMARAMSAMQTENIGGREFRLDLKRQEITAPEWLRSVV
ncbi:MAG: DEAD/DEAH box helicase [Ruminococcus sp.]|nr:DEAD/DEAH box helicase [Ruminococcus sp.]MCM1382147.1 DEAD/DEAH box helicase [Muribaculaceae bacterium]MCM1480830.1 DEAD/DEAH box helicase [Muribaculaceae bacterium]